MDYSKKYFVLSIVTLGQLMAAIDSTIVFLAMPAMGQYFHAGISYMTWIIVGYILSSTVIMIPSSEIIKKFGKKRIYLYGFLIFALSSLVIVFSVNVYMAIIFRFVEGIGAGILGSTGIPILLDAFPPMEKGRAVGISSISWAIGTLIGPVLGGYLVLYDWRYIFLINVPIGIVAYIMGQYRITRYESDRKARVSLLPSYGLAVFLIPLIVFLSFLNYYALIVTIVAVPFFAYTQLKKPVIPKILLKNRYYLGILISSTFQAISFFGVMYALSYYFQIDLGVSSFTAAIYIFAYPLASIIANPIGGYLLDRTGRGLFIMIVGLMMQFIGIFMVGYTFLYIPEMLFLAGFGGSLFWAPSTTMTVEAAGPAYRNIANSSLFTMRNLSLVIGISLLPVFLLKFSNYKISSGYILSYVHSNISAGTGFYLMMIGVLSLVSIVPLLMVYSSGKKPNIISESVLKSGKL
ncbi:MAG: MFS transporter [Thermoplasmata archaeon]